jgi:hypothetical protein
VDLAMNDLLEDKREESEGVVVVWRVFTHSGRGCRSSNLGEGEVMYQL